MGRRVSDMLLGGGLGLFVGALPGLLAAGVYVTVRLQGDLRQVDLLTWPRLLLAGTGGEIVQGGGLVGLGVMIVAMLGGVALFSKSRPTTYGSAEWATARELDRAGLLARKLAEVRGPIWGKLGTPTSRGAYLSSAKIIHSLVVAPTGAGKGVGVVIPTLLTYTGSTVVLDVKGENYEKTARRRQQLGDNVFRFAPYAKDRRSHRYNPFDELAAAPERRRYSEALRLANSLVEARGRGTESWFEGAREIFAATAVVALEHKAPTIAAVYDLLTQPGSPADLLAGLAEATASGEARSIFNRFGGLPEKVLGSYMSVLFDGGLRLWADPDVRDATAASDFEITRLRSDPGSVFICVSQKDLSVLAPLIRLMFQQMFTLLQETDRTEADTFDVLFLLDEFASLGKMEEMGRAITTVRSSGAHLMLIIQSLPNLREIYGPDGAANFMGNCELQLFMAPTDVDTPRYISEAIGDQTRMVRVRSWRQRGFDAASIQERQEGIRLIRPEQIRLLGPDAAIALIRDRNPVRLDKVRYYEDRHLKQVFDGQKHEAAGKDVPLMPKTPLPGESAVLRPKPKAGGGKRQVSDDTQSHPAPEALPTKPESPLPRTGAVVASAPKAAEGKKQGSRETSEATPPDLEERLDGVLKNQSGIEDVIDDMMTAYGRVDA